MSSPALRDESHEDTMDYYGHDSHNSTDMLCIRVCTHIYFVAKMENINRKGLIKYYNVRNTFLFIGSRCPAICKEFLTNYQKQKGQNLKIP